MATLSRAAKEPKAPRFETIPETEARTGIPARFLRRLIYERRIPFFKIGRRVFLNAGEVDQWIMAQRVEPVEAPPVRLSVSPGSRREGQESTSEADR